MQYPKLFWYAVCWAILLSAASCDLARIPSLTLPTAAFSVDKTTCEAPCTITITNRSTDASSYRWDFGNGQSSSEQNPPKLTYFSSGIYVISLIVLGEENTADTLEQTISITQKGTPPIASFKVNSDNCTAPCDPGLDARGSLNTPSQFNWEIYDSNNSLTKTLSGATPAYSFEKAGQYRVKLSVNNSIGQKDDTTQIINIKGLNVLASFKLPEGKIFENCPVEFINQSQNSLTYSWTVNNGVGTSTLTNPNFSFPKAGSYNITLTAKNGNVLDDTIVTVQVFQFTGFNKPIAQGSRRNHYDSALSTADGKGYMLLGYSESVDASGDIILQKIDDQGNTIGVSKRISLTGRQDEYSFVQRPDGGYIIAAHTGNVNNEDALIVQTNADGDYEAAKTITIIGSGRDVLQSIKKIPNDGGYILAGWTTSVERNGGNRGEIDVWLVKLDKNGIQQWEKTFGRSKNDVGVDVAIASDGNFVICVQSNSFKMTDDYEVVIIKADANNGNQIGDEVVIGTSRYDYASKIINATGGGFLIVGSSLSIGNPAPGDIYFVKLRESLTLEREKTIPFSSPFFNTKAASVVITADGNYAIVGEILKTSTSNEWDGFFLKVDPTGIPLTTSPKLFGGTLTDRANGIIGIPGCGFLIVGEGDLNSAGTAKSSFLIRKIDSEGNL